MFVSVWKEDGYYQTLSEASKGNHRGLGSMSSLSFGSVTVLSEASKGNHRGLGSMSSLSFGSVTVLSSRKFCIECVQYIKRLVLVDILPFIGMEYILYYCTILYNNVHILKMM